MATAESREEYLHEHLSIYRRFAAELAEQCLGSEVIDHLTGIHLGDGCEPYRHVAHGFSKHSAEAHHHGGSELFVGGHSCNEFAGTCDHRGDEHAGGPVLGACPLEEFGHRPGDFLGGSDAQTNQTPLGLVRHVVAAELCSDGKSEILSCLGRSLGISDQSFGGKCYSVARQ